MSPTSKRRKRKSGTGPRRPVAHRPPAPAPTDVIAVAEGLSHPVALRHPNRSPVRIVGVLALAVMAYLLVPSTVNVIVLAITFRFRGLGDWEDYRVRAGAGEFPEGLLASNLGIATMIAVCLLLVRWFALAPPGIVLSVVNRLRWGYLAACGGVALVVFAVVQAITWTVQGATVQPQPQFWWFLAVVVLTSPLQAAAEEVLFRGFLQQGIGSLTGSWVLGVVLTSLLFAFAHGLQSPALFVDRLVFGLVMGALVWRTGGLEAAIGAHIVNNILAFVLAGLTSTIAEVRSISIIGWDKALIDVLTFAAIAAGCWLLARRWGLVRRTPASSSRR